eukprot:366473-Chlamydomonas_euryale.AAC.6
MSFGVQALQHAAPVSQLEWMRKGWFRVLGYKVQGSCACAPPLLPQGMFVPRISHAVCLCTTFAS